MAEAVRLDLQGLRGVAVISVLVFHFFPERFPNGYVGVDQFFVLSGFLIAMILDRDDCLSKSVLYEFYYRRIKRIVPLYLLVILLTLVLSFIIFPLSSLSVNLASAKVALVFLSNIWPSPAASNSYYSMLSLAEDLFIHTWSLAVEMQFYALVPFLTRPLKWLPHRQHGFALLTIGAASFTYHAFSDANTSFYSVFARLWQFLVGNAAYYYNNRFDPVSNGYKSLSMEPKNNEHDEAINNGVPKVFKEFLLFMLLLAVIYPSALDKLYLRFATTLLMGAFICCGDGFSIICRISYIGDISYALYLVHWPVYCWLKFHDLNRVYPRFFGVVCSMVIAMLLMETFERCYRRARKPLIISLVVSLYALNACLIFSSDYLTEFVSYKYTFADFHSAWTGALSPNSYDNITTEVAIEINNRYQADDIVNLSYDGCIYKERPPHGWCTFKDTNRSANSSLLILGNSWAANHAKVLHEGCKHSVKRIELYSEAACEVLVETHFENYFCQKPFLNYMDIVKKAQPDYLFIIERHLTFLPALNSTEAERAVLSKQAESRIDELSAAVKKKLFILNAMPRPSTKIIRILNKKLSQNLYINQSELIEPVDVTFANQVLSRAMKSCENCYLISYDKIFTEGSVFWMYDKRTKLSFFTGGQHLSPYGLLRIATLYKHLCSSL